MARPLEINKLDQKLKGVISDAFPQAQIEYCLTCGMCVSGCPASGIEGLDPRTFLRLLLLGQDEELLSSNWIYACTLCARCRHACPM